jgi:hypothetical protein
LRGAQHRRVVQRKAPVLRARARVVQRAFESCQLPAAQQLFALVQALLVKAAPHLAQDRAPRGLLLLAQELAQHLERHDRVAHPGERTGGIAQLDVLLGIGRLADGVPEQA